MSIFEGDNPLDGSAILLLLLQLILVVVLSRILTKILRYVKRSSPSLFFDDPNIIILINKQ